MFRKIKVFYEISRKTKQKVPRTYFYVKSTLFFVFREKAKDDIKKSNSRSNQIIPEIQHLLDASESTDVHDLGTHTVAVTHLDLTKVRHFLNYKGIYDAFLPKFEENFNIKAIWCLHSDHL